ncbi:exodeoxyribonuclease III [Opitutales bacterium]|nr:exodeoxyribonuclease III [Opitutales bacterium]
MSSQKSTLEFVSWNVNGLRACRKKTFDLFVEDYNPDFLCLQEVKLNPDVIPEDDFGYDFRHYHLADKKGYSGTAIFSKNQPLSVVDDFPDGSHLGEGRMVTCEYEGFYLVNVYVPNSKNDLSRLGYRYDSWDPDLRNYLLELREKKPVVLCGDLNVAHQNIDLANPSANKRNAGFTDEEREGLTNLLAEGFLDSYRHLYPDQTDAYSWWSYRAGARARNVGWRLDYFVVSEDLATSVRDATIHAKIEGSDHCPVGLSLTQG